MTDSANKNLFTLLGKFEKTHTLPPVDEWHPEIQGEIDIVINAKGEWFHEGGYFERQDLARMFSSILRLDNEGYFLVTPAEKLKITVEDVPFSIVLMKHENDSIRFITSLGDEVDVGHEHPIEFRRGVGNGSIEGELIPYVLIRRNLWGRINQSTYYELMNLVKETPKGFSLHSNGVEFPIPD